MTISLNQLIDQVREELLQPRTASTPDSIYPFLFIEEVELEIDITVSSKIGGGSGINIQVVEVGGSIEKTDAKAHRIKIKMTPLLSKDEIRDNLKQNSAVWEKTKSTIIKAVSKEDGMAGEE